MSSIADLISGKFDLLTRVVGRGSVAREVDRASAVASGDATVDVVVNGVGDGARPLRRGAIAHCLRLIAFRAKTRAAHEQMKEKERVRRRGEVRMGRKGGGEGRLDYDQHPPASPGCVTRNLQRPNDYRGIEDRDLEEA